MIPQELFRVLLVGATHGNELLGALLVEYFQRNPDKIKRESFETLTLLANIQAFAENVRFIDVDLNRSCNIKQIQDKTLQAYEQIRAKQIYAQYGLGGQTPVNFILDLHGTTSLGMGTTLIIDNEPRALKIAAYLQTLHSITGIYIIPRTPASRALPNIVDVNLTLEVANVHGTINYRAFQETEAIIYSILDCLDIYYKTGEIPIKNTELTVYFHQGTVLFPTHSNGEIKAIISPNVKDYQALKKGDEIFIDIDTGHSIYYEQEEIIYPVFVSEASYFTSRIAFCTTKRQKLILR